MRFTLLLSLLLVAAAGPQESPERVRVRFHVDATPHDGNQVHIRMTVEGLRGDTASLAIPAWAPGAYRIVGYHNRVSGFSARSDAGALKVRNADEQTWEIATNGASPFTVSYTITNKDSTRGGISSEHCDIQGPDAFLYVVGHKDAPHRVTFKLPEGWKVATGLEKNGDEWQARDYDTFVDCPIELGEFDRHPFEADGAKYEVVVHAKGKYDSDGLVDTCRKIVKEHVRMFGGAPYKRYVFIFHFREYFGGGGLEHLNSTSIAYPYAAIRNNIETTAGITSHEFFHTWNVKRIRPKVLGPFDYSRPVRTRALWMCEGVTSYYGDLLLERCGLTSRNAYLSSLDREIETLRNNPDHLVTSAEEASWTIWDVRPGPRISYYNKGLLLGLLIDLRMRRLTKNRKTLDDVLRFLNDWYVKRGGGPIGVGYEEEDLERAVSAVSGHDFSEFFRKYVAGLEELPYEKILPYAGIDCTLDVQVTPTLGVNLRRVTVLSTRPGADTPLKRNDVILKINGDPVSRAELDEKIAGFKVGEEIKVLVRRGEEEKELSMKVQKRTHTRCTLRWKAEPDDLQKRIRESWLTGNHD